jgi:uncharacterized protein (UPF0371 family)
MTEEGFTTEATKKVKLENGSAEPVATVKEEEALPHVEKPAAIDDTSVLVAATAPEPATGKWSTVTPKMYPKLILRARS